MKRARRMGLHPRHDLSNPTRRCVEATIRQRSGKAYRESRPPPPRRWWGFAERLDGAAHTGEGITDRNQLAALTLHSLFSHVPQTRQGWLRQRQQREQKRQRGPERDFGPSR